MVYHVLALLNSLTLNGQEAVDTAAEVAGDAAEQAAAGGAGFLDSGIMMILFYALIIGALWFFMMRPQRKREKKMQEMQESIRTGDNIITSAGFYGKVVSVGEDCFIIEFGTNRGIRIPVRKSDVIGIKSPKIGVSIPAEVPDKQ